MTQRRDLQALIDAAPVGKMQWRVIICCFLVVMLDGFDTAAIGFIALIFASLATHRRRSRPAFWRGSAGVNRRRTALWPVSDRFGRKRVIELCVFLFGALSLASAFSRICKLWSSCAFLTGLGLAARCRTPSP